MSQGGPFNDISCPTDCNMLKRVSQDFLSHGLPFLQVDLIAACLFHRIDNWLKPGLQIDLCHIRSFSGRVLHTHS